MVGILVLLAGIAMIQIPPLIRRQRWDVILLYGALWLFAVLFTTLTIGLEVITITPADILINLSEKITEMAKN